MLHHMVVQHVLGSAIHDVNDFCWPQHTDVDAAIYKAGLNCLAVMIWFSVATFHFFQIWKQNLFFFIQCKGVY